MSRYRLTVSYDGSAYAGWQVQPNAQTIAGTLEHSFRTVFNRDITIIGASRTDAGVHALGQVALIKTELNLEPVQLQRAWQHTLPIDIVIRSCTRVDESFHPQAAVAQKTYWYAISTARPLPMIGRFVYRYKRPIDVPVFRACLQQFVGTYDFKNFCVAHEYDNTVRTIDAIDLLYLKRFGIYLVSIKGQSFLHFMIRRMIGTALVCQARGMQSASDIKAMLTNGAYQAPIFKAPAHGLLLRSICYHPDQI